MALEETPDPPPDEIPVPALSFQLFTIDPTSGELTTLGEHGLEFILALAFQPVFNDDPICSAAVPSRSELWPPNHAWTPINVLNVTDPDGDFVSITIDAIMQDEPINGRADGNTAPDASGVGTDTAMVRAEGTAASTRSASRRTTGMAAAAPASSRLVCGTIGDGDGEAARRSTMGPRSTPRWGSPRSFHEREYQTALCEAAGGAADETRIRDAVRGPSRVRDDVIQVDACSASDYSTVVR